MSALSSLVREWRYTGKTSNATDDDLLLDRCADALETALETAKAFVAVEDMLAPISRDDCDVILQDWDAENSDQRVAMRLASSLIASQSREAELLFALRSLLRRAKAELVDPEDVHEVVIAESAIASAKVWRELK